MTRPARIALIAAAFAFLMASGALARVLAAAGDERGAAVDSVRERAGGSFELLRAETVQGFSLGARTADVRIAWRPSAAALPVVQCVSVRRSGDVVSGFRVRVAAVSPRIGSEAACTPDAYPSRP